MRAHSPTRQIKGAVLTLLFVFATSPLFAQAIPERYNAWDLQIGMPISDIPADAFIDYACGTNGGPPSIPLTSLQDYAECPPEAMCTADGKTLHEVYVEYDDQLEYWARAHDFEMIVARYAGTKILTHPIILSLIFSDPGVLQGIRIVTDPHAGLEERMAAYMLSYQMKGRYGPDDWTCTDLPREERETPMGGIYVKEQCTKLHKDGKLFVEAHFYKQPGQQSVDPHTKEVRIGEFESTARLEIWEPSVHPCP